MRKQTLWVVSSLVMSLGIAGCASSPDKSERAQDARAELKVMKSDPDVQAHAPAALLDAEKALKRAESAHEDGDKETRDHQLYLAERHMEFARMTSERRVAEEDMKALIDERDRLALEARESELEQAEARSSDLEAELAALEAQRTDRGMLLTLNDLFFQTASANIARGATPTLDKVVEVLVANPEQHVIIEGHTDAIGDSSYNQQLSEQRAEAVKDLIVARGIDSERIVAKGYGESRPVASNANQGGRQLNRRVEIVFPDLAQ